MNEPMQCECSTWACADLQEMALGNGHNPACSKFVRYLGAILLIGELAKGISGWAAEEDGVPDWLWEPYRRAMFIAFGKVIDSKQE